MKLPGQRSRGALALTRTGRTEEEIARRIGASRSVVGSWRRGEFRPDGEKIPMLHRIFGIEPGWWFEPAPSSEATDSDRVLPTDSPIEQISARDRALRLETMVHKLMNDVQDDPTSSPVERAKVMSSCASALTILSKLTGELGAIDERKIIRSVAWKKMRERILDALFAHPEALRDLSEIFDIPDE